ncbi:MAG: energy-coupling factor transporter transmembrane protein EcfT [Candidatus Eisenbacteria bacterium]
MRTSWHGLWGCARGPATRLTPQTRVLAGLMLFAVCMAAPVTGLAGLACVAGGTAAWLLLCSPPLGTIGRVVLLGLSFLLPAFILTPLIRNAPAGAAWSWGRSVAVPWSMFVRGLSGMLVMLGVVTSLTASDLREGLVQLPIPRHVSAILLQIIHQAGTLLDETRQVASAMAVRGASGSGRTAWRILVSLPQVWIPRVVVRAEEVASAMEIRGYGQDTIPCFHGRRLQARDVAVLLLASGLLAGAVALRWEIRQ